MSFKLFGFDVRIQGSFFVMAFILGMPRSSATEEMIRTASWLVVVTVSILVHELGHAFANRRFGGDARIELYSLGGLAIHEGTATFSNAQIAMISFAGPLAGFALGGVVYAVQAAHVIPDNPIAAEVLRQLLWVNLGWGLFNLLPLLPLDGGHILQAGLNAIAPGRGKRTAQLISVGVGAAGAGIALYYRWMWVTFVAGWCAITTLRSIKEDDATAHDLPLWDRFADAHQLASSDYEKGVEQMEAIAAEARSNHLQEKLAEGIVWYHVQHSNLQRATAVLARLPADSGTALVVTGARLLEQERYPDAAAYLERALRQSKTSDIWWLWAMDLLGRTYIAQKAPDKAAQLVLQQIDDLPDRTAGNAIDAQLFYAGHYKLAAELGERLFKRFGDDGDAYNVACSLAKLGDTDQAMVWLERSVDAGCKNLELFDTDPDIDALRGLAGFSALRERIAAANN